MKILNKNILREFKFSIARFLSITVLLALGVFILIGLKVTGNDMRMTGNNYYQSHKMADAVVKSNSTINKSDQNKLKKLKHVGTIEFTKSTDGIISGTKTSIRVQARTKKLSLYNVSSGRLPTRSNEIAINKRDKGKYQIGDYITLNNKNNKKISGLKQSRYKIVGFVTSSDYLLKQNLATTTVGTGQIDTYAVVAKSAFSSDSPTTALIHYNNLNGSSYSNKTSSGQKYKVKISAITEMYAGHDIYMNAKYYQKVFGKLISYNSTMIKLDDRSSTNIDKISRQLTKQHASLTIIQSDDAKKTINNILHGLNNLVLIIIIAASLLAFVVLFTLTNINVSERIRELSTIKVLGFYSIEVVMYIYRETLILTIIGILLGFISGSWLHNYIMQTLPPATAMADMSLFWTNFTISGLMTIIFSLIVMGFMARKINKVDMLGALKSVD